MEASLDATRLTDTERSFYALRTTSYALHLLIQQRKREAEMVLVRAGTGSGFGEFLCLWATNRENIVQRKSETRVIPSWFAHRKIIQNTSLQVAIQGFAYLVLAS